MAQIGGGNGTLLMTFKLVMARLTFPKLLLLARYRLVILKADPKKRPGFGPGEGFKFGGGFRGTTAVAATNVGTVVAVAMAAELGPAVVVAGWCCYIAISSLIIPFVTYIRKRQEQPNDGQSK